MCGWVSMGVCVGGGGGSDKVNFLNPSSGEHLDGAEEGARELGLVEHRTELLALDRPRLGRPPATPLPLGRGGEVEEVVHLRAGHVRRPVNAHVREAEKKCLDLGQVLC